MRNSLLLFLILLLGNSCVDRVQFDVPGVEGTLVVDGYISDQPGPYSVHLFLLSKTTAILNFGHPVTAKQVTLFDNEGNSEELKNQGDGVYATDSNGMRGEVGKKYHLRIELPEGTIFESEPDEILPGGQLDSLYYSFESFLPLNGPTRYGFKVFIDATASPTGGYIRWRYNGTFSYLTYPELNYTFCNCCRDRGPPDPFPCSGFVWTGSTLMNVTPCTCCITYVTEPEKKPHLNDSPVATNGKFSKIEMGFVNFDEYTFSRNKYMLKVEQMSLSREAFEFWKVFSDQKEGAASLFQPAFGEAKTNMFSTNSDTQVGGFFYATSLQKKVIFINSSAATISVPPPDIDPPYENCGLWVTGDKLFLYTSVVPPPEWN